MNRSGLTALLRNAFAEHPTRVVLGGGVIAIVAASLAFVHHSHSTNGYRVLARGIRMKGDVKAITTELEKQGVAYQLSDSGRTISVPEANFEVASRQISKEKLYPRSREQDFRDMMDKSSGLTMLPDMQRLQRQRLQELEIARTISMYDSVEFARVHISQPHETMFRGPDASPVTASIFLELSPGRKLVGDQVAAIKSLVSHSVEGLFPANITLCDSQGTDYSSCATTPTSAPVSAGTLRELELAQLVETVVLGKVTDHLRRLFEPESFAASVTADLETTQLHVRPALPAGPEAAPGGARTVALTQSGTGDSSANQHAVSDHAANDHAAGGNRQPLLAGPDVVSAQLKSVETRGRIRRLSISILIDSRSLANGALDPCLRSTVEEGIKAGVGFRPQRGDTLSVLVAPFIRQRASTGDGAVTASYVAVPASGAPPAMTELADARTAPCPADRTGEDPAKRVGARAAAAVRSIGRQLKPDSRASGALTFVAQNFNVLWISQVSILIFMLALLVRQLGGAGSSVRLDRGDYAPGYARSDHGMYPVRLDQLLSSNGSPYQPGRTPSARCLESLMARRDRDIEGALARADEDTLVLILRSGAESLRSAVLARLPAERARELTERIAAHGPVTLGQLDLAQIRLADLLLEAPPKGPRSRG